MNLVICEKPSVAMSIAKVIGATGRQDGYYEGGGYIVSWCVWIFLYDEIALPEIWKLDVRKWKSSMRVYSRNALSRPYTSRMDFSCSASMLVMLI